MATRKGIRLEVYQRYAAEGYSQSETARELGVTPQTVRKVAEKNLLTFVKGYKRKEKRDADRAKAARHGGKVQA